MSQFRASNVYIQARTRRMLSLIVEATNNNFPNVDALADYALLEWASTNYPKAVEFLAEQDKMVKEFLKEQTP